MAENENDWDLQAVVRSYSNRKNSVLEDQSVHEDATHGSSVNNTQDTTLFQEESDCVGDFTDSFAMENKRYFGLDEVISLSKNLNTNSRIEPHNQEKRTGTIPNTPLEIVEHEEEKKKNKKARYLMQSSSTELGKVFRDRRKSAEQREILAEELSEADQWRWKKYRMGHSTFPKIYYKCGEVEDCPAKRHVQKSSTDPNKLIVTYRGQHNHPPNQHSLSKNLNSNSRIEPHNQENQTGTIPNTPLVIVEHEEEKNKKNKNKKMRYSMQSSTTEQREILAEELSEADQGRWKKYRIGHSTFPKIYYKCVEVEDCPAKRHVQKSSTDPNKVIVTYIGQHNHPPNQHIAMVHRSPNAAVPVEDSSFPSSTTTCYSTNETVITREK